MEREQARINTLKPCPGFRVFLDLSEPWAGTVLYGTPGRVLAYRMEMRRKEINGKDVSFTKRVYRDFAPSTEVEPLACQLNPDELKTELARIHKDNGHERRSLSAQIQEVEQAGKEVKRKKEAKEEKVKIEEIKEKGEQIVVATKIEKVKVVKKGAEKKTTAPKPKKIESKTIMGHSLCSVLRWMGTQEFSFRQAQAACTAYGFSPGGATIYMQMRLGKTKNATDRHGGVPASLDKKEAALLLKFKKEPKEEKKAA